MAGLNLSANKRKRIKRRSDFSRVFRRGKCQAGRYVLVHYIQRKRGPRRLGVTSSKLPNAVARNRAKRLLREAYRHFEAELPAHTDLILVLRAPRGLPTYREVEADLQRQLRRAGLLAERS